MRQRYCPNCQEFKDTKNTGPCHDCGDAVNVR